MEKEAALNLNDKMKDAEKRFRTYLPKKTYSVIRVDGKGFSKYTKSLVRPFDAKFTEDMQKTALYLCENIDGAVLGYTQSDEISIIVSDLSGANTQQWFGGQIQKIVSVSAGFATAKFNHLRPDSDKLAVFDARTHVLDGAEGVLEYLQWRQMDAIKNSVSMLASHHFSHKSLQNVSSRDKKAMLEETHGIIWQDLDSTVRQGSLIRREPKEERISFFHGKEKVTKEIDIVRNELVIMSAPFFKDLESIGVPALLEKL